MNQRVGNTVTQQIRILLIEDNLGDARLIQEALQEANNQTTGTGFELIHVDRLSAGLERLAANDVDVALVDLSLPDSVGLETLIKAHASSPGVPMVVLTSLDDEALALEALKKGAQDYLIKGQMESSLLVRTMRYAMERRKMLEKLGR